MKNHENHRAIPDWKCERYLLGELDDDEMDRIRGQARQDRALATRLLDLERSNAEILADYPAGVMAAQIEAKFEAAKSRGPRVARQPRWRSPFVWFPAAAVAVVGAIVLINPGGISDPLDRPTVRVKGSSSQLSLYRRTATGSERLEDRTVAAEHDLIRARYELDGQSYGLIVSVDGRGALTRHHPEHDRAAVLMAAGSHALEFSYELDDAPRWEIFMLASSSAPFTVGGVIDPIAHSPLVTNPRLSVADAESVLRALELPEGISLSTLTLLKEIGHDQ